MKQFFEGDQAAAIGDTTQNILMDYLRGKLTARADVAALCPGGLLITHSVATASNRFNNADNQAFVLFQENGHAQEFERIPELDENDVPIAVHRGQRHSWNFEIQLSARNDAEARKGPSNAAKLDRKLSDIVCQIFEDGYLDLLELGVTVTEVKGNGKPGPGKINPHSLSAESVTMQDA